MRAPLYYTFVIHSIVIVLYSDIHMPVCKYSESMSNDQLWRNKSQTICWLLPYAKTNKEFSHVYNYIVGRVINSLKPLCQSSDYPKGGPFVWNPCTLFAIDQCCRCLCKLPFHSIMPVKYVFQLTWGWSVEMFYLKQNKTISKQGSFNITFMWVDIKDEGLYFLCLRDEWFISVVGE